MTNSGGEQFKEIPELPPSEIAALLGEDTSNDTGIKEARLLSSGYDESEIRKRSLTNEHHRNEHFRDHFESVAVVGLWVVSLLFLGVGVTWFWHLMMPPSWQWLSTDQISKIQNIVTGGIITSLAAGHIKRRLG